MDTDERRATTRPPHWSGVFLRRARVVQALLVIGTLLFGIASGIVGFGMTDHNRARGAVQYSELNDSLRWVRDSLHLIRVDQSTSVQLISAQLQQLSVQTDSMGRSLASIIRQRQNAQILFVCEHSSVAVTAKICQDAQH